MNLLRLFYPVCYFEGGGIFDQKTISSRVEEAAGVND